MSTNFEFSDIRRGPPPDWARSPGGQELKLKRYPRGHVLGEEDFPGGIPDNEGYENRRVGEYLGNEDNRDEISHQRRTSLRRISDDGNSPVSEHEYDGRTSWPDTYGRVHHKEEDQSWSPGSRVLKHGDFPVGYVSDEEDFLDGAPDYDGYHQERVGTPRGRKGYVVPHGKSRYDSPSEDLRYLRRTSIGRISDDDRIEESPGLDGYEHGGRRARHDRYDTWTGYGEQQDIGGMAEELGDYREVRGRVARMIGLGHRHVTIDAERLGYDMDDGYEGPTARYFGREYLAKVASRNEPAYQIKPKISVAGQTRSDDK